MQPQQVQHNQPQPQIVSQEIYDSSQQQIPQIFDNFFTGTGPAGTLTPPSVSTIYPAQDEGYITFSGKGPFKYYVIKIFAFLNPSHSVWIKDYY